jgi:hypothetical protein
VLATIGALSIIVGVLLIWRRCELFCLCVFVLTCVLCSINSAAIIIGGCLVAVSIGPLTFLLITELVRLTQSHALLSTTCMCASGSIRRSKRKHTQRVHALSS